MARCASSLAWPAELAMASATCKAVVPATDRASSGPGSHRHANANSCGSSSTSASWSFPLPADVQDVHDRKINGVVPGFVPDFPPKVQSHHTRRRSLPPRHARAARPGTHRRPQDHPDRPRNQQSRPRRHHPGPHLHRTLRPRGNRVEDAHQAVTARPRPPRRRWGRSRRRAGRGSSLHPGTRDQDRQDEPARAAVRYTYRRLTRAGGPPTPPPRTRRTRRLRTRLPPLPPLLRPTRPGTLPVLLRATRRPAAQVVRRLQSTLKAARPSSASKRASLISLQTMAPVSLFPDRDVALVGTTRCRQLLPCSSVLRRTRNHDRRSRCCQAPPRLAASKLVGCSGSTARFGPRARLGRPLRSTRTHAQPARGRSRAARPAAWEDRVDVDG